MKSGGTIVAPNLYRSAFERLESTQPAGTPKWLAAVRERAMARFDALGFPTTADEEWRFTNVEPIAGSRFALRVDGTAAVDGALLKAVSWSEESAIRLVFVNGRYAPGLSVLRLPEGVEAGSLRDVLPREQGPAAAHVTKLASAGGHAFTALNTAFLHDGAWLYVPGGAVIVAPIELLFLAIPGGEPTMSHPRVLIVVEENSQVRIVETYAGPSGAVYLTNAVTEIAAGANAVVDHYKVQRESFESFHVASMHVRAARSCNFSSHSIVAGGGLVRNDVTAVLDGEGVDCTLNGLYVGTGSRLVDNHTLIDHARPHCGSHEVYKGILADRAQAVFNGKIVVRPDAQKTDAKQTNKALLLSEDAQINTKPQLEIFADDVKCTHGATIGQLDEDALFYLRTRGIGKAEAWRLLIRAFAGDILNRIRIEPLRGQLADTLLDQLPLGTGSEVGP